MIKEGIYEDMERRDQLFEIARFRTTKRDSITLKEYVAGLKPNQTAIYYITAEEAAKAAASPQLEGYKARDVEVLLLTDPVDGFWVQDGARLRGQAVHVDHPRCCRSRPDPARRRGRPPAKPTMPQPAR